METTWTTTLLLIAGFILFLILAAYLIAKYGNLQGKLAHEYEVLYGKIDWILTKSNMTVCDSTYDWICMLFDSLKSLKYKNPEMTEVLENKFRLKFADIIRKRKVEEMI